MPKSQRACKHCGFPLRRARGCVIVWPWRDNGAQTAYAFCSVDCLEKALQATLPEPMRSQLTAIENGE